MLITNAEIYRGSGSGLQSDLRIENGRIVEIGKLLHKTDEPVLNARGGTLLPGLHDHHIHLLSYAASLDSLSCGPPDITTEAQLVRALRGQAATNGRIRGFRYHESVAGDIDRHWLDDCRDDVPVRIQHRSGRLWIINSTGLALLNHAASDRERGILDCEDGRCYDQDDLLGRLTRRSLPPTHTASQRLASFGVTGITDMTPGNTTETLAIFSGLQADGALLQRMRVAGTPALASDRIDEHLQVGATKVHLHESGLPPFERLCETVKRSHTAGRTVAIHCVTETELVFALAALRDAGVIDGDRIEHASVTPPALLDQLRELDLMVVTQPNFIAERGDAYREALPRCEHAWLYRCRGFLDAGIRLAGGTDAPFGNADPWRAMHAAVQRTTPSGETLGLEERLTPEQAVALFLGSPEAPEKPRQIAVGVAADLCLLNAPWSQARTCLSNELVAATIRGGELIYHRVDQSPC